MPLEKTDAIVLRSVPWSETSLVVTLWTREFGKISAIAKGARRLKSPFESALDLLSLSSVVFLAKTGDTLDLLFEAKLQRRFRSAQRGLLPLYCGFHVAELTNGFTEPHQPIPGWMDWLTHTLQALDDGCCPATTTLRFELHALRMLGLSPSWSQCVGCGESVDLDRPTVALTTSGGGVACPACSPLQRNVLRIQTNTVLVLQKASDSALNDLEFSIPEEARSETRFVMEHLLGFITERRLRLLPFLEELKR
ncbi:MAG: DNA repair protein RecO [Pirellula sp.]|jgi:DNA repair protein RecO (recombination protein O)|nr:DNA repair protein RecO [Pirellula sp.]